jgi:hypothetical protein
MVNQFCCRKVPTLRLEYSDMELLSLFISSYELIVHYHTLNKDWFPSLLSYITYTHLWADTKST